MLILGINFGNMARLLLDFVLYLKHLLEFIGSKHAKPACFDRLKKWNNTGMYGLFVYSPMENYRIVNTFLLWDIIFLEIFDKKVNRPYIIMFF